jgi:hypothetical protein
VSSHEDQFSPLTAITASSFALPFLCGPCGFRVRKRAYHQPQFPPTDALAGTTLDPFEAPRPSLKRSNTSYFQQQVASRSPPLRRPTFAERVERGVELSPWTEGHPSCLRDKYRNLPKVPWQEECLRHEQERQLKKLERKRQEQRRASRQLDGPRSLTPSPSVSRLNTGILTFDNLKRRDTGSSATSAKTGQSSTSSRISSFLNRIQSTPVSQDDRDLQRLEARQADGSRKADAGADCKSDTAPHEGQGQRGLFGKHKGKSLV